MFIEMPIKKFKLDGNTLCINENCIKYDNISDDDKEILESLISKGAYGSALLTLNTLYNVKSINESAYSLSDYTRYLKECNDLMSMCVTKTTDHSFRPLINLKGFEIMENDNFIARGKGNTLLIEDFRNVEILDDDTVKYTGDGYTGNSRSYEIVFEFSDTDRSLDDYTRALNEISQLEYDNKIDKDTYDKRVKQLQDLFINKEMSVDELTEDCEGTQVSDIAEKKDQEVGSLQKNKRVKKLVTEILQVPRKHGFKGFRLNEYGMYVRGNYILINENGNIKAINKKLLESLEDNDGPYNQSFKVGSKLDLLLSDLKTALDIGASKIWYEDEDFVKDMCTIEASEDENNSEYIDIWFLAEVSYSQGTKMVDEYLDDVLKKYDEEAYFEAETSGRWIALVRKNKLDL